MISSIFNKSKPINLIIVFFITLFAFLSAKFIAFNRVAFSISQIFEQVILFLLCFSLVLLLNFIINKNNLGKNTNYGILIFSLFLLLLPQTTVDIDILFSNFFILLALRRIISIRSKLYVGKKVFDAAFWVAIAAFFYFWAILFFLLIIISLLLYKDDKINHWIIPFIGLATVFVISIAVSAVLHDNLFEFLEGINGLSFNYYNYNSTTYLVAITLLLSFGIWSSIFYVKSIKSKKKDVRESFNSVLVAALLSFVIVILAPQKSGSEFLFMFAPLSIIIANYIETIQEQWFKELFLLTLILGPIMLLIIES